MFKQFTESVKSLNNSKFFAGLIMIMLNIGSKYITIELSKSQEQYLRNSVGRQLLIFSIAWMGSRDIYLALAITAIFYILTMFLFNEDSKLCVIPRHMRNFNDVLDQNKDGVVSKEEIENAHKILDKAKKDERKREGLRIREQFSTY
jgi:hypothetical protein